MKEIICGGIGMGVAAFTAAVGGWDNAIILLIALMIVDYVSGWLCAAIFHKSKKTKSGTLKSSIGYKGLVRKGMILAIVMIANQLDKTYGSDFIRDAVIIGFSANEMLSIVENAGLMGLPIPDVVKRIVDVLQEQAGKETK